MFGLAAGALPASPTISAIRTSASGTSPRSISVLTVYGRQERFEHSPPGWPQGIWLAAGVTQSPDPFSPVTPPTNGTTTVNLALTVPAGVPQGSYPITVETAGGGTIQTASATLVIGTGPTFSITATPSPQTVAPGGTASYTVQVSEAWVEAFMYSALSGVVALWWTRFVPQGVLMSLYAGLLGAGWVVFSACRTRTSSERSSRSEASVC